MAHPLVNRREALALALLVLGSTAAQARMRPNGEVREDHVAWLRAGGDRYRDTPENLPAQNMQLSRRRALVERVWQTMERVREQVPRGAFDALLAVMVGPPSHTVEHGDQYDILISGFPGYIEERVFALTRYWGTASRRAWIAYWTNPANNEQWVLVWHEECNNLAVIRRGAPLRCRCDLRAGDVCFPS